MSVAFYQQWLEALRQGPVVLATVSQIRGSVPREVGARMLVLADGRSLDTIGGGAGEAKVLHRARQVLVTGEKGFVEIDLSGAPDRIVQGVCGGWMRVWLERWQGEGAIALVQQICDRLQAHQPIILVTPFAAERSPYLLDELSVEPSMQPGDALIEQLCPPPVLLTVGAGHVGVALAWVAERAGFAIAIQDDRPDFADAQRFPSGTHLLPLDGLTDTAIAPILTRLTPASNLYIALVTRGYLHDQTVLKLLWQLHPAYTPRYIGMIGSKKRVHRVFQSLQQEGVSPQWLQHIHAPIGISIGALTPEEIAISICAELIQVRRQTPPGCGSSPLLITHSPKEPSNQP